MKKKISKESGFQDDDGNSEDNIKKIISSYHRQLLRLINALTLACGTTRTTVHYHTIHRHRHKVFAYLCVLVTAIFVIRYHVLFLILFFAHPPIVVPPIVTDAVDSNLENLPLVPLYVLSASDERWFRFKPPKGTRAIRVTQSSSITETYMEYIDPAAQRRYGEGTLKCATGHLYIWDMVARDPLCARAKGGCLIAEDDAIFVGQVDPRPFLESYAAAGPSLKPDFMSFYKQPWEPWSKFNRMRTWLVAHIYGIHPPEEPVLYVTFGWGLVAYMLTSQGAEALLDPLRGGKYYLDDHIDRYIYDRWNLYWHDVDTFVDRRYPLEHGGEKSSARIKADLKKKDIGADDINV